MIRKKIDSYAIQFKMLFFVLRCLNLPSSWGILFVASFSVVRLGEFTLLDCVGRYRLLKNCELLALLGVDSYPERGEGVCFWVVVGKAECIAKSTKGCRNGEENNKIPKHEASICTLSFMMKHVLCPNQAARYPNRHLARLNRWTDGA